LMQAPASEDRPIGLVTLIQVCKGVLARQIIFVSHDTFRHTIHRCHSVLPAADVIVTILIKTVLGAHPSKLRHKRQGRVDHLPGHHRAIGVVEID
jgi:hypothetical protein